MRKLGLAPLVFFCIATSQAQTTPLPEAPPGVSVLKFSWRALNPAAGVRPATLAGSETLDDPLSVLQSINNTRTPRPIGIPRQQQRRELRPVVSTQQGAESDEPGSLRTRNAARYTYRVKVRNGGDAAIQAVHWEYVFIDSVQHVPLGRHRFLTFRRVAPGKTSTLEITSLAPPTRVVTARAKDKGKEFEERITIRCVAYTDGTVRWMSAGSERDCDALKREQRANHR